MRIGITGSRHGLTNAQKVTVTHLVDKLQSEPTSESNELHHGACLGADEWFVTEFRTRFLNIHAYPSTLREWWSDKALDSSTDFQMSQPPLVRNRDIVDASDVLIAMPDSPERLRSGTWATVRYAIGQRKRIYIVYPDGSLSEFK
jgi:hypothetical protein